MADKNVLVKKFEKALLELVNIFRSKHNDYFFTEKELHSYFYHLCLKTSHFDYLQYNLIHTEYPTPFKCETLKHSPYIKKADDKSVKSKLLCNFLGLKYLKPSKHKHVNL